MMSSFSVAFADSMSELPVVSSASDVATFKNEALRIIFDDGYDDSGYYASASASITFFYVSRSSAYDLYLVSLEATNYYWTNRAGIVTGSLALSDTSDYYFKRTYNITPMYTDLVYSDFDAGLTDALSFLNAQLVPPAKSYYSLQNGWLSVIDLGSSGANYDFVLNTTFQMNSGLISGTWGNGTSQRFWFSNNLLDENTSYLSSFGNAIDWEKGYPRNVFGQTKNATCTISGTSSGRYLYILNPALQQIADVQNPSVSPGVNNHSMTISGLTNGMNAKIYKLTGTATINGLNNAVDINNVGSVTATDSAADLTNSFINDDNDAVVQNAGGGNENEVAQSVNGYLQGIQNALDNFVNQFIGLLSAPISHIQQMIESGSNFFSVFGQLFSWLPEEVSIIITGSLLVMVIIGVFKMFL